MADGPASLATNGRAAMTDPTSVTPSSAASAPDRTAGDAARQLRDRVHELTTLLDVLPIGIGIAADRECATIEVNAAFATTLGLARDDNASLTAPEGERPTNFRVLDAAGREVPADQLPMQVAARDGRTVRELEVDVVHDDGRVVRLLEYAAPLFDDQGEPRGAVGAFIDITDRRRADERAQFLVRLDDALRTHSDPAAILARACELLGRHLDATRCAYAAVEDDQEHFTIPYEYTPSDAAPPLVGRWALSSFGDTVAARLRTGHTLVVNDVHQELPQDAGAFAALSVAATVCAAAVRDGRLTAMMAVHSARPRRWHADDVALVEVVADRCWESLERARAVRELQATSERYRMMADVMPQLVWTAGADGAVDYYSARASNYSGLRAAAAGTTDWQPMIHPEDLGPTVAAWRRAMADTAPYAFEHRLLMANGEYRWHLSRAEPIRLRDEHGAQQLRWFGTATDVHELRQTQTALRVQEERLREMDRRKDEFLAILAHELRNPLAPLRTAAELLQRTDHPADTARRVAPVMLRQITQMVRLIDDLLDVSRITAGRIQLQRQPAPLEPLVQQAVDAHRSAFDEGGVTLTIDLPAGPCWIDVDPTRFVQIVSNLLHNAAKFTPRGGTVRIAATTSAPTSDAPGTLRLRVVDTGAGIAADDLADIFTLFVQGREAGGRSGLGIGLALARQLVALHGGRIDASSDGPGRGACFTVELPVLSVAPAPLAAGGAHAAERFDGQRVLVVDDNRDAAETLSMVLTDAGADVRTAADGQSAIAEVAAWRPDAVLLDIGMPDLDGYDTCRAVRQVLAGAPARIVAVTGFGQEHDKRSALDAGFDAHLTKPVTLASIAAALESRPRPN
jgi:PAS domain S-box-containing protein